MTGSTRPRKKISGPSLSLSDKVYKTVVRSCSHKNKEPAYVGEMQKVGSCCAVCHEKALRASDAVKSHHEH